MRGKPRTLDATILNRDKERMGGDEGREGMGVDSSWYDSPFDFIHATRERKRLQYPN